MNRIRDLDIRAPLIDMLLQEHQNEEDTLIVNEMGVLHGQSRVDVAVVNGIIHGFEIKSECDSLYRLKNQMEDYNKVFDRMTIVAADAFVDRIKEIVPLWWGIVSVKNKQGTPVLRKLRKGRVNAKVDPLSLVHFLWKEEAIEILKQKGLHRGYLNKPKLKIYQQLVDNVPLSELKMLVNQIIKNRQGWRDPILPVSDGGLHQQ